MFGKKIKILIKIETFIYFMYILIIYTRCDYIA